MASMTASIVTESEMADVLVVGAGPVGLTMAAELARHGVSCRIVDRLDAPSPFCRAIGVTPRTLEVFENMGLARSLIEAGLWIDGMHSLVDGHPPFDVTIDLSDLPYAQLGAPQYETERVLAAHLETFGVRIERGGALSALSQDADGVAVRLAHDDGRIEDAAFAFVVGCDGAHSTVRHALGIDFEGEAFPMTFMLGDVRAPLGLPRGRALRALRLVEDGPPDFFVAIPLPEPDRYRVSMLAPDALAGPGGSDHGIQSELGKPTLDDLQGTVDRLLPDKPRLSDLRWSSLFRISMRLAQSYQRGRAFLAGDAAHIHPPTGGQGMNTGIQDAYNLAWKLALVVRGEAPESLLDSYEAERRPIGAEVVARTRAASEGFGREKSAERERLVDTQILVSYRGTPWVRDDAEPDALGPVAGDRAHDAEGLRQRGLGFPVRMFDALRGTGFVLIAICFGEAFPRLADLADFARSLRDRFGDRMRVVAVGDRDDLPEQPGLTVLFDADGAVARAYGREAMTYLVRPDGHVAWRGPDWRHEGLSDCLDRLLRDRGSGSGPGRI